MAYAEWAGMRLLTEAEWEKAASWLADDEAAQPLDVGRNWARRQGVWRRFSVPQVETGRKRKYPWGDQFDKSKCNTAKSGINTTTAVGVYSPQGDSWCGAADMAGNVLEWCSSLYSDYPYCSDDGRENLAENDARIVRGGSFYRNDWGARCSARDFYPPDMKLHDVGFRMCVSFGPDPATLNLGEYREA